MAKYYFDIHDGDHDAKDDEGTDFPDLEAMRKSALALLPDIAREVMPNDGNRRDVIVDVRDSNGMVVFTATLSLIARWVG